MSPDVPAFKLKVGVFNMFKSFDCKFEIGVIEYKYNILTQILLSLLTLIVLLILQIVVSI